MKLLDRLACKTMLGMRVGMGVGMGSSLGVVSGGNDRAGCGSLVVERAGTHLFAVCIDSRELS